MSNKPKGVKIHPNNKISNTEIAYNALVRGAMNRAGITLRNAIKEKYSFRCSKHFSIRPKLLKLMITD